MAHELAIAGRIFHGQRTDSPVCGSRLPAPGTAGRAALLAMVAGFAVPAHHIPTCDGFSDPQCNVDYFYAHQVDPAVHPYTDCRGGGFRETASCLEAALPQPYHDLVDAVMDVVMPVYDTVDAAACEYFGACD